MKKFLFPLLVIILTIPTFVPLIRTGYFPMQDDQQAFRLLEMDKCFSDFQIPCRWIPDGGYQYGYPQFEYYGPSVYYLGEVIHKLGFQFIDSIKILFALGYIIGALGMFFLLREYLGEYPALVGSLLYTYAPYKADEVYVRGDMNEFWSLALFPFIFWAVLKLVRNKKSSHIAWIGVSSGLLLMTHNLMSLIFLPIAGLWGVTLISLDKEWKTLPKLIGGFLLGVGLAAFFTLPVLAESKYAHLETLLGGYFGFEQHFVSIKQMFVSNYWGYGSSVLGPYDDLSLSVGVIQWVSAFVALILAVINYKNFKKLSISLFTLGAVDLIVVFMMHPRSIIIWNKLPFLAFLQFPWRFLADSTFLLSFIGSAGVYLIFQRYSLKEKGRGLIYGLVLVVSAFILYLNFFQPKGWLNISDHEKFSGASWTRQLTSSIFDYLPIYAKFPPIQKAPGTPEILDGKGKILNYQKGSDFQKGEVVMETPGELRLPLFDFPGMKVWVDGKETPHGNSDCRGEPFCMGLINVKVAPGTQSLEVKLTNTPIRTVGNSLTILSLLIILGLLVNRRPKKL